MDTEFKKCAGCPRSNPDCIDCANIVLEFEEEMEYMNDPCRRYKYQRISYPLGHPKPYLHNYSRDRILINATKKCNKI